MKQSRSKTTRYAILLIVLAMVTAVTVAVSAHYIKRTDELNNTFTPAKPATPEVEEKFDGELKEDVSFNIGNTGYLAYVRVAVIITWKDKDGVVYFKVPEPADYELEYTNVYNDTDTVPDAGGWVKIGDYYYFTKPVDSGGKTLDLVKLCRQLKPAPEDGYTLSVEFIVQTVQAIGFTDGEGNTPEIPAYMDAWDLDENHLSAETAPVKEEPGEEEPGEEEPGEEEPGGDNGGSDNGDNGN